MIVFQRNNHDRCEQNHYSCGNRKRKPVAFGRFIPRNQFKIVT